MSPLFESRDSRMICAGCGAPSEIDTDRSKPGEIHYQRCACGEIGIRRETDRYQQIHRKKTTVVPYEKRYRG